MDQKVLRLSQELKSYDRELVVYRDPLDGKISIMRKKTYWETFELDGATYRYSKTYPEYVISLTTDWKMNSPAADWGIEPVLAKIKEIDPWRNWNYLEDFYAERDRAETTRKQSNRNEIRARAYDCRRDFARATNEINTSTLAKIDHRREREKSWKMKGL